jgi:hypothetical protein
MIMTAVLCTALLPAPLAAQMCGPETIAAVIDATGSRLRQLNADNQAQLKPKLREVARRRGWPDSEIDARGYEFLRNDEVRALDAKAGQLLLELDRLGDEGRTKSADCDRLVEAKAAAAQLVEVTAQRAARASARLDEALRPPAPPASKAPGSTESPPKTARAAEPPPPSRPPASEPWDARTRPGAAPSPEPPNANAMASLPRPEDVGERTFTAEDIRAAGRGFFGTLSAELAAVIEYAFRSYGSPNGYVLGTEGGGAFLAGLRYGQGTLVTKSLGQRRIYWQGPSLGTDFGVDGSRVMFLVYNIQSPDEVLTRFAGVDGSAYFVGGVGITFLKKGRLVLAPIRTGLGLRLGASVGYLKFTSEPSLNPF